MEDEYEKTLKDQIRKLPKEVTDFILSSNWDTDIDEIGTLYNLSPEEMSGFKREVTLVLVGIIHPDAFMESLKQEVGIKGAVLEALVLNVEKKIFVPIRPALIEFFEQEAAREVKSEEQEAPDNLPTEDASTAFLPKLIPKTIEPEISPAPSSTVHPFEEKMKNVFTASQPTTLELPQVEVDIPRPPAPFVAPSGDPYREPIE